MSAKTQRVRIAVAMTVNGVWHAAGGHESVYKEWTTTPEAAALDEVAHHEGPCQVYYVEADVPIPVLSEGSTVEGKAQSAGES